MDKKIHFGIIGGRGSQAKLLVSFIPDDLKDDLLFYEYSSKKFATEYSETGTVTYELSNLLNCEAVLIASPNHTHFQYLKFLIENKYSGYIYCEKPPVLIVEEIEYLENIPSEIKERILFGFNLHNSIYYDILQNKNDYGKLEYCNIINGHGLGFKNGYIKSWRNDATLHKMGVFETVTIHYLELFLFMFGFPEKHHIFTTINSPVGKCVDNCVYNAQFKNTFLSVYVSYTTPYINRWELLFENAYLVIEKGEIIVYSPRDTFDEKGRFTRPPISYRKSLDSDTAWNDSLRNRIEQFCQIILTHSTCCKQQYDTALLANRIMIHMFEPTIG